MSEQIALTVLLALYASVVVLVYRDAERRSIDPWPWTLLVLFLPLIGIAAYVARVVSRPSRGGHGRGTPA